MKRIFFFCSFLAAIFFSKADPISFTSVTPSENSEITSWNFTLKFNIEDALASVSDPTIKYGLGWQGSNTYNTKLYQGDTSGELLGTCMNTTFSGKSEGFDSNPERNEVSFSFDSSIPIVKGQIYTVAVHNRFCLYKEGATTVLSGSYLDYRNSPLLLTFKGGDNGKLQFILDSSSIKENESYEYIDQVSYFFGHPVTIDNNKVVSILENGIEKGASSSFSLNDDATILTAIFENPVYLDFSHKYSVILPEGTASHISDASLKNSEKIYNINGTNKYVYDIKSSSLNYNESRFPIEFIAHYDLPESKTFTPSNTSLSGIQDMLYLYQISDGTESEVARFKGSRNSYSILWTIDNVVWNPSTNYLLKTSDDYIIFDSYSGEYLKECSVQITSSEFVTPTIEEMNLPKIELNNTPRLGAFNDAGVPEFKNGGSYASIGHLEVQKTPYLYNGQSIKPSCVDGAKAYIYEVTNGERTFIKDAFIGGISYEEKYEYVSGFDIWVNTTFYSGHKYEIVIPAGSLEIASVPSIRNYTTNEEIVYTLNGATTKEIKLESCSVKEGETLSELAACVWVFDGSLSLKQGATGTTSTRLPGSAITSIGTQPLFAEIENGKTYVTMSLADRSGKSKVFDDDSAERWLTLPAGVVFITGDEETYNEEIIVNFKGASKYVTLSVETEGLHAHSNKAPKGEFSEVRLTPDSFWEVSELTLNGEDVTADLNDGVYTTPVLTEDTSIKAKLAYNGSLVFADTSGVAQFPDANVKVYSDGDTIVVEGVATGDEVVIYSISGMVIGRHVANQDTVRITIGHGQYIVRVGNNAANILH